ncbi:hypothetical protein F0U60_18870 [Archangium minus]|uniref:EamA domain-containing protein n=1 Tax=Archangium minus TaxID=83450 RepID=A0ABY9WQ67_9BACT|nr:hypothetical protein F0U61_18835 [Archangium violaceum]WNG45946.1 hypothetical protein F0U60_18870 [Archangium minus]
MPPPSIFLWFILTLALSLSGQVMLKKGVMLELAGKTPSMPDFLRYHLFSLCFSRHALAGVLLCGLGVICWLYVLSRFEIARALPILGGLSYVLLFFIGRFVLREPMSWVNLGGILLIITGLYLVSLKTA